MSIWIKAELDRRRNLKGFALHEFDILDIWDFRCTIDTVDRTVDKLRRLGIVPDSAHMYAYEFKPDAGVHHFYFIDKSFKEVTVGEMTPIQYVTGEEMKGEPR